MDPKANIDEQRELTARLLRARDGDEGCRDTAVDDAVRLAELVEALDNWRKVGGADPYLSPAPSGDPLEWAVHQDGAVIRLNWAVDGVLTDEEREVWPSIRFNDHGEGIFSDPAEAARVAAALKSAAPDQLCTIVLWHQS